MNCTMNCDLFNINKTIFDNSNCSSELFKLQSFHESDIVIILTEAGILPHNFRQSELSVCSTHSNQLLKRNEVRKRRALCMVPRVISTHPDVDHSEKGSGRAASIGKRKSSKYLAERDIVVIQKNLGIILPVGTPSCVSCKVKIKDMDEMPSSVDQHLKMQDSEIEDRIPVIEDTMSRRMQQQVTELSQKRDHTSSEDFHYYLRENKPKIVLHDVIDIESTDHINFSQSLESHESPFSSQQTYLQTDSLTKLNDFLKTKGIQPLVLPQHAWGTYSQKTKKSFVHKLFSCFTAVTETMFPNESDEILKEILKASEVIDKETDVNSDVELCQALVESYKVTDSWQVRRQILSVICQKLSFKNTCELIDGLTEYRYCTAKKHASVQGCALPPEQGNKGRQRMDPSKLDNFLDFITSSHIIKDLPFGERKLKLADGRSVDTPNVIRCMAPAAIIDQFKQYCSENEVTPLGDSTMFKILSECAATVRKSLEGLDYYITEGVRAFQDIQIFLEELRRTGDLSAEVFKRHMDVLLECKRYLKTDYKVHISSQSTVPDHCKVFALSDHKDQNFNSKCLHEHDSVCQNCEQISEFLSSVQHLIEEETIDDQDIYRYKINQAVISINSWKQHICI
ncbi:uncharacterized protein LOC127713978 [Mytilus californianus]|uniref:uncharacterized protein LOC127713978 n=1 Tax=Mytilus californianus TaxID=6549 RepID=UPI00224540C1|nr:uncharacterized protein LOC127713978 [Mytilus californianus]